MRIISDVLGKEFTTVEECQAAEKEYAKELAEREAKKQELATKRKERASEIEESYKKIVEARNEYNKLINAFVKDFGSYHLTVKGHGSPFAISDGWFDDIFNILWK